MGFAEIDWESRTPPSPLLSLIHLGLVLNLLLFLLLPPAPSLHSWWLLAPCPESYCRDNQQAQTWQERERSKLEREAWRRLMAALLSWQQQDGLEIPLPESFPLALPGFQSLSKEARGLGRAPKNTGGASGWHLGRWETPRPRMLFWQHLLKLVDI